MHLLSWWIFQPAMLAYRRGKRSSRWWWFQIFLEFSPRKLGKRFPIWRSYFSIGLVQPPTSICRVWVLLLMAEIRLTQLRLVVDPIIYDGFQHHPRWLARFQPSTVSICQRCSSYRSISNLLVRIFSPRKLGKRSNLTSIFQLGKRNHQPDIKIKPTSWGW